MKRRAVVVISAAVLVGAGLAGAGLGLSIRHSRRPTSEHVQEPTGQAAPPSAEPTPTTTTRKPSKPGQASNAHVPLLGVSVATTALLAKDRAEFGPLPILREYYTGLPPADAWTKGLPGASKSAVIVSFKALPSAILSGADDARLSHFFDTAPTGHPIYYSYYHEPERHIAQGQFSLAAYKAAWARVVALADAAHNPYLHSTLILVANDFEPGMHRDWRNYLPAGHIISVLAWDAYPVSPDGRLGLLPEPPAEFMGQAIAASKSVGLPYGFAEFGLSQPNGRPAWLTEVGNYLMNSGAQFGILFNSALDMNGRIWDVYDQPASIAAWRHFTTESAALTGNE